MQRRSITLTFHGIGTPSRALEAGEEAVWVGSDRFLAVLDAAALRPDVRITFDDGNDSDVEHALPALRERGLRATFFVVAGRLGTPGFLDPHGVRTLVDAGMAIGCHGMRHRRWRRLDDRELHEELVDARHALEAIVGSRIDEAACPFGSYDRRVLRTLRRAGYRHVYTSDRGTTRPGDWLQPRNTVGRTDGAELIDRVSDGTNHRAVHRRARLLAKRWR